MKECVLITGATSGIGRATAKLLASKDYRLILTGRREERLKQLKDELITQYNSEVCLLHFDIRDQRQVFESIDSLTPPFNDIDILINNAGLAVGYSSFQIGEIDDWERMIDTNIKGLLYITRKISAMMAEKNSGHIINISSIAGKEVYPYGNVYCASKHAVQSLTKSLRLELLKNNIKVSSIAPGAVKTEFSLVRFKGDEIKADKIYEGFTPLSPEDIADVIYFMITRPAHVTIDDIIIMPTEQAYSRDFNRK